MTRLSAFILIILMTRLYETGTHPFYIGMYIHIYTHIYVHIYTSQKECLCIFCVCVKLYLCVSVFASLSLYIYIYIKELFQFSSCSYSEYIVAHITVLIKQTFGSTSINKEDSPALPLEPLAQDRIAVEEWMHMGCTPQKGAPNSYQRTSFKHFGP